MVDFRKFCPIFILAILMQASILKKTKDNNKTANQMVLKNSQSFSQPFMKTF